MTVFRISKQMLYIEREGYVVPADICFVIPFFYRKDLFIIIKIISESKSKYKRTNVTVFFGVRKNLLMAEMLSRVKMSLNICGPGSLHLRKYCVVFKVSY